MIDQISDTLAPGGTVVVVEWDWNAFDEPTARWCFERLAATDPPGWLHRQRDEWAGSGRDWDAYLRDWTQREGLHAVERLLRSLNRRFEPLLVTRGPYFFADLAGTSDADERAAIDAGRIRATRIDYTPCGFCARTAATPPASKTARSSGAWPDFPSPADLTDRVS